MTAYRGYCSLLAILTFAWWEAFQPPLWAQCAPYCVARQPVLSVKRTHSGRLTFAFPRYSLYVNQTPRQLNENVNGGRTSHGPTMIYKSDTGMMWSGAGYFNHPAYHDDVVTRYHYAHQSNVGRPIAEGSFRKPPLLSVNRHQERVVAPSVPAPPVAAPSGDATYQFVAPPWVVVETKPFVPALEQPFTESVSKAANYPMYPGVQGVQPPIARFPVTQPQVAVPKNVTLPKNAPVPCDEVSTAVKPPHCYEQRRVVLPPSREGFADPSFSNGGER